MSPIKGRSKILYPLGAIVGELWSCPEFELQMEMWFLLLLLNLLSILTESGGSPLQVINIDGTSVSDRKLTGSISTSTVAEKPVQLMDILDCTGSNGCLFIDQFLGTSFGSSSGLL